jgi:hypothetical protein
VSRLDVAGQISTVDGGRITAVIYFLGGLLLYTDVSESLAEFHLSTEATA